MINIWNSHIERISGKIKEIEAKIDEYMFIEKEIGLDKEEAKVLADLKIHCGRMIDQKGNLMIAAIRSLTDWPGEAYRIKNGVAVMEV